MGGEKTLLLLSQSTTSNSFMRSRLEVSADQPATEPFTLPCVHETLYVYLCVREQLDMATYQIQTHFHDILALYAILGFNVKGVYHDKLRNNSTKEIKMYIRYINL